MTSNRPSFDVTKLVTKQFFMTIHANFYLNNYLKKDGTAQIFYDVTINKERDRIPTGLFIKPEHWDNEQRRVKSKFDNKDVNLSLDNMEAKTTEIRTFFRLSKSTYLDIHKFREEFFNKTPTYDFLSFMNHHIEHLPIEDGTKRHAKSVAKKLSEYKSPIAFADLNLGFFENYRGYLHKNKKNKLTTINSNIKTIKKYINLAIKHGIFVNFSIDDLRVGSMKGSMTNLDLKEVAKLKEYYTSDHINPDWKVSLGYFLFSCFTSLRISEILSLKRADLFTDSITFTSKKTSKMHTVVLNKTSKMVIAECDELFDYFPTEQYLNRNLKLIMNAVGIKKRVSMHVGRHTFATNYLRKGGRVVDLQHILNHSSINTTMLYVHIVEKEADSSVNILDD